MKNLFTFLLSVSLIFGFYNQHLNSQTIELGNISNAQIGQEVLIPVNFEDLSGIAVIKLYITYKTNVLTWEQGGYTNVINELSTILVNSIPDTIPGQNILTLQWFSFSSPVDFPDGKALDFVFTYQESETELAFTSLSKVQDGSLNTIDVTFINGSVSGQTGSDNSVWSGTGNWLEEQYWSNGVPGSETEAIIATGTCSITNGANCKSLQINNGAILQITPNNFLTVNEYVTVDGELSILSDETGTGSFIHKGNIDINGDFNVENHINAATDYLVSSPVMNINAGQFTNAVISKYIESDGTWMELAGSDLLTGGSGYLVDAGSDETFVLNGDIFTGDITCQGIQYTAEGGNEIWPEGLNLVGNPYTCAIDWDLGAWNRQNINGAIYVWDGYNYLVWNGEIGNLTDGIISVLQGFFVVANNTNPTLTIPADARIHSSNPVESPKDIKSEYIILKLQQGDMSDFTYVQFDPNASDDFDNDLDAYKLPGSESAPQVYSIPQNGHNLAINVFPKDKNKIVDIGYVANTASDNFKLEYIKTYTYFDTLYLLDTEDYTKIYLNNDSIYTFNSDAGTYNSRFKLYFTKITTVDEFSPDKFNIYSYGNVVYINSMEVIKEATIDLIGLDGKVSHSKMIKNLISSRLDFKGLKGMYIIRVSSGGNGYSKKVFFK
ncbi:MAG: hypothetical protein JW731_06240 [Bacteroidales bacterium]|nr:hypothetical protein [Bacteroidales bacterium]